MSSRRVIRRHQPLISLRIPFDVQRLPPPPTITLRKNFQSTLRPSNNRIPLSRRPPFIVPIPIAGGSAKNSESRNEDHAAPVTPCMPGGVGSLEIADVDKDADEPEYDLSDIESEGSLYDLHPHNVVPESLTTKPPGEAGRPGSGGFNLEETLGWPKEYFNKIQKQIQDLVSENLDESNSYNKQPSYKIDRLCRKMEIEHTRLREYENCWPILCMIKSKLKSSSEIARRQGSARKKSSRNRGVYATQSAAPGQS